MDMEKYMLIAAAFAATAALLAAGGAIAGAAWSKKTYRFTEKAEKFKVFLGFLNEYRTPDMLAAVRDLHAFKRKCERENTSLKDEYKTQREKDEKREKSLSPRKQPDFLENSLHTRRRLVSHYYYAVLAALESGLVDEKDVFGYWKEDELKKMLVDIIGTIDVDRDKHLERLPEKAKRFECVAASHK